MIDITAHQTSLYAHRFQTLKAQGQKAFIPFTLLGWPDMETSLAIIKTMLASGVAALELGLPFSDPMADGPIIQQAAVEALENGFRVDDGLTLIKAIRQLDPEIPIGLLIYYNLMLARGIERFFKDFSEAGVTGFLIADLPPEAMEEVAAYARQYGVDLIFIVSPLTTPERLTKILQYAGGFLYVVSRLGITGTEERYDQALGDLLNRIRQQTDLPACVGFGISTPTHAEKMFSLGADGVITGSRIIQLIQETPQESQLIQLQAFLNAMVGMAKIRR